MGSRAARAQPLEAAPPLWVKSGRPELLATMSGPATGWTTIPAHVRPGRKPHSRPEAPCPPPVLPYRWVGGWVGPGALWVTLDNSACCPAGGWVRWSGRERWGLWGTHPHAALPVGGCAGCRGKVGRGGRAACTTEGPLGDRNSPASPHYSMIVSSSVFTRLRSGLCG